MGRDDGGSNVTGGRRGDGPAFPAKEAPKRHHFKPHTSNHGTPDGPRVGGDGAHSQSYATPEAAAAARAARKRTPEAQAHADSFSANRPKTKERAIGWSDPADFIRAIKAKTPVLLELGKPKPKIVLSFGGAGWLVAYSLGVAHYLLQEQKELCNQSYIIGAGSGVLPATALACGISGANVNMEKIMEWLCDDKKIFSVVKGDEKRKKLIAEGCKMFLPRDAAPMLNGKCSLMVGMSNRDQGFVEQKKNEILFGHHISSFDSNEDITELMIAATCTDTNKLATFRGAERACMRATCMSFAAEADQYIRHVYIHGLCGYPYSRKHMRHNHYFGKHGFVVNTHQNYPKQFLLACFPTLGGKNRGSQLRQAFDDGFHDARRYERWEEDPYHFVKPDRSTGGDEDWRTIRAAVFGAKKKPTDFA